MSEDQPIEFTGAPEKLPLKVGSVSYVDTKTGEVIETKHNAMTLVPPGPGMCPECGRDHPFDQPHNKDSVYYQLAFAAKHGRHPTWRDALSHCTEDVRRAWRELLIEEMTKDGTPIPDDLKGDETPGGSAR